MDTHQLSADTRCYQDNLPKGMDGKRESKETILLAYLDDNNE